MREVNVFLKLEGMKVSFNKTSGEVNAIFSFLNKESIITIFEKIMNLKFKNKNISIKRKPRV
jgi:hypothetical protein